MPTHHTQDSLARGLARATQRLTVAPLLAAWVLALAACGQSSEQPPDTSQNLRRPAPDEALLRHDQLRALLNQRRGESTSASPRSSSSPGLELVAHAERLLPGGTTDVWVHDKFAYLGTFNTPCGDGSGANGSGIRIYDVKHPDKGVVEVSHIPSVAGSRSNDVKVAKLGGRDLLVHSNESCAGGPGGFELWDVEDPLNPVHLASVRIDELNPISDALFGGISDVGVHNLWLFRRGGHNYVGAVAETAFDNFMIFDISEPTAPVLASSWGAEELFDPGVGDLTDLGDAAQVDRVLDAALWLLDGFGNSANRFLHDITISQNGKRAYLSNWDAGLVLLDISDPANPQLVSVALDPSNGSLDGEVNSHAAWPSENGKVVVESEEDFDAAVSTVPPGNLTFGDFTSNTIPGTAISTVDGDAFEANQLGNTATVDGSSVSVSAGPLAGSTFAAIELSGNQPTFAATGPVTGEAVWIGSACPGDPILNAAAFDAGDIAVVRRGTCFFSDKLASAAALGAAAVVITNNQTNDTPWGGIRIWDYSDPANPLLASTFNTLCSANPLDASCDPRGTYSVHNVMVEEQRAYISWYSDGVLVLDISDPYNPVEIARYNPTGAAFESSNGGIQDVWGIYKDDRKDLIYGSDRNGGLYVLKLDDDD